MEYLEDYTLELKDVTYQNLLPYMKELKETRAAETVNKTISAIRHFYKFLINISKVDKKVLDEICKLKYLPVHRTKKDYIDVKQIEDMKKAFADKDNYAALLIALRFIDEALEITVAKQLKPLCEDALIDLLFPIVNKSLGTYNKQVLADNIIRALLKHFGTQPVAIERTRIIEKLEKEKDGVPKYEPGSAGFELAQLQIGFNVGIDKAIEIVNQPNKEEVSDGHE